MAQFLYKIGLAAHDHRKKFIASWVAILTLIGVLAGTFMGTLSNTFSLPGTETERVLNLMHEELPELSGGNGTIVFQTNDGEPFSDAQRAAIVTALEGLEGQTPVRSVLNPFEMQDQIDNSAQNVADGEAEIAENEKKLEEAQAEVSDGSQQLLEAEEELVAGEKEIFDNEAKLVEGRALLLAGERELEDARKQLDEAEQQLADGEKELADGRKQFNDGRAEYEAGLKEFKAGEQQFNAGKKEYNQGVKEYEAGKKQIADGEKQIAAAKKQLAAGTAEYEAGKKQYDAGIAQAAAQLGTSGERATIAAAKGALQQISGALSQIPSHKDLQDSKARLEQLGMQDTPDYANVITAIETRTTLEAQQEQLNQLVAASVELPKAAAELEQGNKTIAEESAKLEAGRKELKTAEKQLTAAKKELDAAEKELKAAEKQLSAAKKELDAAEQQLTGGEKELADGRAQYEAGLAQYNAGVAEISRNEKQLEDGERQLAEGRKQLEEGRTQIEENKQKLEDARIQIADGKKQLEDGRIALALGLRTVALTEPMSFINKKNNTAISQVMFYGQPESLTADERADIQSIADSVEATGVTTLFSKEILSDLNSIFGITEVIGLIIAGIVLFVMFGTFLAVGLPLLMALSGVAAGVGGTLALSSLIDMQSITPALALMLGLAVGIDYTLFIVHRHRTQLLAGMPLRESIGRSIGTSGNAVVFAGLTVIIALSALVVSGLPFIAILGLSAAFTVLMSVLLSITLTPALLAVMGEKVLTKKGRAARAEAVAATSSAVAGPSTVAHTNGSKPSASLWWVKTLTSAPWLAALASIIVLGVIAIPVASMKTALPDGGSEPYGSDAQRAYEITSQQFGPGFNGQLILLAELDNPEDENAATEQLLEVAERISRTDGVFAAVPAATNQELTFGAIQIVPASGPADPATEEIVHELRGMTDTIKDETGVTAHITGQVAAQIDVSEKINAALPPYLIIVVGLSLILMLLVFRSIVVPLIATLGFLLSLAAAFGSTVAVYQWGWFGSLFDVHNPAPIMSFLPILLTGILFGLAMDYQVFLVTAMREAYAHGSSARDAVKQGFNLAAPVVVAAALIMVSVFAGFTFSHLTMIRPIGFALAIGVLFDAFVVRMTLTPAIMHLLGDKAWYLPAWLERILPDVDVEGAKLEDSVPPADSTESDPALAPSGSNA